MLKVLFLSFFKSRYRKLTLREAMLSFLERRGIRLKNEQLQMIVDVIEMETLDVEKIKVPNHKIVALPVTASLKETLSLFHKTGYSRLPVYQDKDARRVYLGLIYAKDLLSYSLTKTKGKKTTLKNHLSPIDFVPETQRLFSLLRDMRIKRSHLALTVNEYGDVTGLITLENILEEIVGDIRDEFDSNSIPIKEIGYRKYQVDASLPLNHINKTLAINLPEEKFNTLAGYFLHECDGKELTKGLNFSYGSIKMQLEDFSGYQIKKIIIHL